MLRFLKNCLRAALPPALFIAITVYFGWNAIHGARGLLAQDVERAELAQAQLAFASIDGQRQEWETRIADLNSQSIGPDMLDDQARQVLNLAEPNDLVVQLADATTTK